MTRTDELSLHELISCHTNKRPDSIAVQDDSRRLTFAQLEGKANRLARHFQRLGVGTEVPVGLYFRRSVDFVIAALAALKAGGAYVPLDATYPAQWNAAIMRDAGISILASHKWMAATLPRGQWRTIDLDIDRADIERHSEDRLSPKIDGRQLAYVAYSSGSTAKPIGVEITHSNLLHLVRWHHKTFSVSAVDRASQVAGLALDAAVWEIWCNLSAGASLHFADDISRESPDGLQKWLLENRITIAFAPSVLADELIRLNWPKSAALRLLLTGTDTFRRYPKAKSSFAFVNKYGPPECTALVTAGAVSRKDANSLTPSIGRPIDDTEVLILDKDLLRVERGEQGEICVAGPQIGRGYRNLPGLTAERFTQELETGRRLFRTGDRGRILPDGSVAFLGRLADRSQICDSRTDADQVVEQLNLHPHIRSSAVFVSGDQPAGKFLVAYLVTVNEISVTAAEVREFLRARVPGYMVPSIYVVLPSLPTAMNGKFDQQALPAATSKNRPPGDDEGLAACTTPSSTESRIAQLVSGLMSGRNVQRHENFFVVGGHSMLAAQLLLQIREIFQVNLSLRQLFESPTIVSLSAMVNGKIARK